MYVILIKEIQEWRVLLKYKPRGCVSTCQQINRHLKIPQFRNTDKTTGSIFTGNEFCLKISRAGIRKLVLSYESLQGKEHVRE